MPLISSIDAGKAGLTSMLAILLLAILGYSHFVNAESLTYSPDQWPRHWNVLMNKTQLQNRLNGYRANGYRAKGRYKHQTSVRSPMWGVVPTAKRKSRRSLRPEYNTNAHMRNYFSQNNYQGNYYSGLAGFGLANPYNSPLLVPGLMPGFVPVGIPFATSPYAGGFPGSRYLW